MEREAEATARSSGNTPSTEPPAWLGFLLESIARIGFPAVIALYLLLGVSPVLMELRDAVRELIVVVREMKR